MRVFFLITLAILFSACAQKEHPHQAAARIKAAYGHTLGAQCLHFVRQAEKFDDKLIERRGLGMILGSVLGPLSWPINKMREDQHTDEQQAIVAKLESECKSAPVVEQPIGHK